MRSATNPQRSSPRPTVSCNSYSDWTDLRGPHSKTVTRVLSPEQLRDYRPLLDNAKRLRELVTELQDLTLQVLDTDDRWRTH